jgi:hypothetical protein
MVLGSFSTLEIPQTLIRGAVGIIGVVTMDKESVLQLIVPRQLAEQIGWQHQNYNQAAKGVECMVAL